jgi:hypothetical protein
MKKATMILALAAGVGFMFNPAVMAIHPMQFSGMILNYNTGTRLENEIMLEDWMLQPFDRDNSTIAIEDWMLDMKLFSQLV